LIVVLKDPREVEVSKISTLKKHEELKSSIGKEKIKHKFSSFNRFSAEIKRKDLDKLMEDKRVKKIYYDWPIHAFLQNSTEIVNATSTWPIQISRINLTGEGETVCVIDTGVNYSHPDLGGCYGDNNASSSCKVIGGYDFVNNDNDPMDDHGHGTHVAGIVAANGSIRGIAPGAKIVAIKVLDSSGGGYTDDLISGIEWCINNASLFNISVITMSLGCNETANGYISYCDSESGCSLPLIVPLVNNATAHNISVIAATGNYAWTSSISAPACIQNATAVGATTKGDVIASYSNRNNITDLFAPGGTLSGNGTCSPTLIDPNRICSTALSGGYISYSGTSMAAPHVAGAFALIRQFKRLETGEILTPQEIQDALNNSGETIYDSKSGLNFSRIDVYSAILSLDETPPNITLISPLNNTRTTQKNITFSCNATDFQLANVTLFIWNSTSLIYNETKNLNGKSNETEFNVTNLDYDNYEWNCYVCDLQNNCDYAEKNLSLNIKEIITELISPENNTKTNEANQTFYCNSSTGLEFELSNITLQIWNSTSLIYNKTKNLTGKSNQSSFNFTLPVGENYEWNCFAYNNRSYFSTANSNFTLIYDTSKPEVILISPSNSYTTTLSTITFKFNVSDNLAIKNCSLVINSLIIYNQTFVNKTRTNNITQTLSPATYLWNITCIDEAGNVNTTETRRLIIESQDSGEGNDDGGGGGGGGGGSSYSEKGTTHVVEENILNKGYTKKLSKDDKVRFSLDEKNHTLSIIDLAEKYIVVNISSKEKILTLVVGESKKTDLNNDGFYDLLIKLNFISGKNANITLKKIFEKTRGMAEKKEHENKTKNSENTNNVKKPKLKEYLYILVVIIITIIVGSIIFKIVKTKNKKNEKQKKKRKKFKEKYEGKEKVFIT